MYYCKKSILILCSELLIKGKRFWHTVRLWSIPAGLKRAEYLRNKKVFASVGEKCVFMDRKKPLYANLIKLGDNVNLASNITFVTHDISHRMLNIASLPALYGKKLPEKIGCIEIGNNVFIGTGSIVTKDIPDNSIAVGIPARVISDIDTYLTKRLSEKNYDSSIKPKNQEIGDELKNWCWEKFKEEHNV